MRLAGLYRRTLARGIQSDFAIGRSVGDYAVGALWLSLTGHDFGSADWVGTLWQPSALPRHSTLSLICSAWASSGGPLAAQVYGARKPRLMRRTIRQGLWISVMLGILSIGALWPAKQIFLLLG